MATGTAGSVARRTAFQGTHYLRNTLAYNSPGSGLALTLGKIPAFSLVLRAYAVVTTAFNDSGTDLLDIGTSGTGNGFMSAVSIAAVGVVEADDMATTAVAYSASEVTIQATYTGQNANASAGSAEIIVEFIPGHGGLGD